MDSKVWMIFGGVGLFLTGMYLMETALSHLAGRNFKLLLRRNTSSNAKALVTGVVTTAVLQSSSIVSFLTLAFAGSGLIGLQNALAVILGANIGTTLANWIIATLGFSMGIDMLWYPLLGLAGLALVAFQQNRRAEQTSFFAIGLTFLFIALAMMKEGMMETVSRFDFTRYASYPPIAFVLIGFVMTFLIQSSTATVAITLSALYAKAIPFHLAVAVVIGSELGTSLKLVLAAAGGSPEKKRLAAGNILLNLVTTLLAFAFIDPLIRLVTGRLGISDPLQGLVAFQTVINLAASVLFFPFLGGLADRLSRRFGGDAVRSTLYIDRVVPTVPGLAQDIFRLEVFYFLKRVLAYNAGEFRLSAEDIGLRGLFTEREWEKLGAEPHAPHRYDEIKLAQGEIMEYYARLQKGMSNRSDVETLRSQMYAVQSAMHAAKGFKDIHHNKNELLQSGNDLKFGQFARFNSILRERLGEMSDLLGRQEEGPMLTEPLKKLLTVIQDDYNRLLQSIYMEAENDSLPEKDISMLQNMNRELYSSHKSMVYAIAEFSLPAEDREEVTGTPVSAR
jgi:phosphate:Na+ symporter